jgi:hypothetical protein
LDRASTANDFWLEKIRKKYLLGRALGSGDCASVVYVPLQKQMKDGEADVAISKFAIKVISKAKMSLYVDMLTALDQAINEIKLLWAIKHVS